MFSTLTKTITKNQT